MGEAKHATDGCLLDASLYTQPEDVYDVYAALSPISPYFSVAVGFGNTHGIYKPGNIQLKPSLLGDYQSHVKGKTGLLSKKPVFLVFHGGSGSTAEEFNEAIRHGVVKVNINADTQFAMMTGIKEFMLDKKDVSISEKSNSVTDSRSNGASILQVVLAILMALMNPTRSFTTLDCGCVKARRKWLIVWKSTLITSAHPRDFERCSGKRSVAQGAQVFVDRC